MGMFTFRRMNYRRKKISMKERLEEAIEEMGGEPPQGSGLAREVSEEGFSAIKSATPEPGQPHGRAHRRNAV
jgi:hypothetical protein